MRAGGIWAHLSVRNETGGIWRQLSAIRPALFDPSSLNVWTALGNRPGGMWDDLRSETIALRGRGKRDIWEEVNDETLIIRPQWSLWLKLAETLRCAPPRGGRTGIWAQAGEATLRLPRVEETVWSAVTRAGEVTQRKPLRRLGWALKRFETVRGETYYVLKNTRTGAYLRLTEQQVFLWNLMDGEHTVQDIAVACFVQYRSLAIKSLLVFLGQLEAKGFLGESRVNVYARTAGALGRDRLGSLGRRLWSLFAERTFPIRGIDGQLDEIYRAGVKIIFTKPVQILALLVTLAGLAALFYEMQTGRYSVLQGGGEYLTLGLVALYVAEFLAIFVHEGAHAFTCKHYHREVRSAGFMIYLGLPAFFVDTTDIWMETRRPRILVSFAGPYSGLFLAGAASLLIPIAPSAFLAGLLYQFAFANAFLSFANLNPLLQLDGYYILMDWLEIPQLRARALDFAQGEMWRKLRRREAFGREDKLFAAFGVLSLAWTGMAIFSTLQLAGGASLGVLQNWMGPILGQMAMVALMAGLAVLLLWPYLSRLVRRRTSQMAAA